MKYLIAYTQEGAERFCTEAFTKLQPHPPDSTTLAWTSFTLHPQSGIPLIYIPESFPVPIVADLDPTLFDEAFAPYLNDGTITLPAVEQLKSDVVVAAAAGQTFDLGAAIVALFSGTAKLLDHGGAIEAGWLEPPVYQ